MSPSKGKRPTTGKGGAKAGKGAGKRAPVVRRSAAWACWSSAPPSSSSSSPSRSPRALGDPSIPSGSIAVVEEIPDGAEAPFDKPFEDCKGKKVTQDLGDVTKAEFDCAFQQVVASSGLKKTPKPGDKQYDELKETTVGSILETIWIQGLAAEEGISVTEKEVEEELKKLKKQNFKTEAEFQKFLKTSHYTTQDVNERVKIQILSTKIQEQLGEGAGEPSKGEIEEYYEEAKATQFTTPPTRDVRILIAKNKKDAEAAKAALLKDNSPDSWKKVVKKYSETPSPNGGLQPGVTEEQYAGEVGEAIFAAPVGKVEGPVKYATSGYIVFQVEKKNPEKVQPLGEAEAQIKAQLQQQNQEAVFGNFVSNFQSLWRSRTFCAERLHGRKMLQLQERRPPGRSRPGLLRSESQKSAGSLPGAGLPGQTGAARARSA